MLEFNRKGYAVMTEDLKAYSIEDESLETCKEYCRKGYVIAERIPYKSGIQIRITWNKWWKPFYFKYQPKNILWLHWSINPIYFHKTGKIVYYPPNPIKP